MEEYNRGLSDDERVKQHLDEITKQSLQVYVGQNDVVTVDFVNALLRASIGDYEYDNISYKFLAGLLNINFTIVYIKPINMIKMELLVQDDKNVV